MNRNFVIAIAVIVGLVLASWFFSNAEASRYNNTTNNYFTETTLTSGISNEELSAGLVAAMAMGGHQFYNTFNWQASLVGAWGDDQNGLAVGLGKKWKNHPNLLFHGGYTEVNSKSWVLIGGTLEF